MSEFVRGIIYKDECPNPKCRTPNYWSAGNPEDATGADVDGLECWKCHHEWLFDTAIEFGVESVDAGYIVLGAVDPSVA